MYTGAKTVVRIVYRNSKGFEVKVGMHQGSAHYTITHYYVSLIMRGSSMLHGSETWPVRKENLVALQRVEMRMVRCGVKLKDRLPSKELRERD